MRLLAAIALVSVAAILAGCQTLSTSNYNPNANFSSPVFADYGEVATRQDRERPPYVFTYPDETMFFFPIYSGEVRSDLNLRSIRCSRAPDGSLVVTARVSNMGSTALPTINLGGDMAAFRISALVTWTGGIQQEVDVMVPVPMPVPSTVEYSLRRTHYFAADVTRIDVVADPDRVVPDPVRLNNVLSWQGKMNGDSPNCDVTRS
jgi:hypothetical protein